MRSNRRARLVLGQRRRRLVEDQQPRLLGERPGDDHQLLRGEVERAHRRGGVEVEAEGVERLAGAAQPARDVDHPPARRLVVERDVLGDAEVGDDVDLLRHQRHAGRLGLGDAGRREGPAGEAHAAVVAAGRDGAGEDLDQRRLAGAVLAEQRHDLAGGDREARPVERAHAGEALGQRLGDAAPRSAARPASLSCRAAPPSAMPGSSRPASCRGRSCRPRRRSASAGACRRTRASRPG